MSARAAARAAGVVERGEHRRGEPIVVAHSHQAPVGPVSQDLPRGRVGQSVETTGAPHTI